MDTSFWSDLHGDLAHPPPDGNGELGRRSSSESNNSEVFEHSRLLVNLGSSCYMSAGVQLLMSTPAFVDVCLDDTTYRALCEEADSGRGGPSAELIVVELGREMRTPQDGPVWPRELYAVLTEGYRAFGSTDRRDPPFPTPAGMLYAGQQCCGEFVGFVLNLLCESRCERLANAARLAVRIELVETVRCVHVLPGTSNTFVHRRSQNAHLTMLNAVIAGEFDSVPAAVGREFARSELGTYRCEEFETGLPPQATCCTRISRLPRVVLVQLRRTQWSTRHGIAGPVRTALPIAVPRRCELELSGDRWASLQLVGIVRHLGSSSDNGHYVADTVSLQTGTRLHFDDVSSGPLDVATSYRSDLPDLSADLVRDDVMIVAYVPELPAGHPDVGLDRQDGKASSSAAAADAGAAAGAAASDAGAADRAGSAAANAGAAAEAGAAADAGHVPAVAEPSLWPAGSPVQSTHLRADDEVGPSPLAGALRDLVDESVGIRTPVVSPEERPRFDMLRDVVPLAVFRPFLEADQPLVDTAVSFVMRCIAIATTGSASRRRQLHVIPLEHSEQIKLAYDRPAEPRQRHLDRLCVLHALQLVQAGCLVAVVFDRPRTLTGIGHFIVVHYQFGTGRRRLDVYDKMHGRWSLDDRRVAALVAFVDDCCSWLQQRPAGSVPPAVLRACAEASGQRLLSVELRHAQVSPGFLLILRQLIVEKVILSIALTTFLGLQDAVLCPE
eukprot:TRINITY_DN650_c0_g1_i4.p1 TRINITY_DN650_c0_g1~~TRINITY_DN650_c0_g1_i4.p1  ORF type:complete len:726 (+),score=183.20 TRINITY_DN650_c0_g1_i4:232-2409(+)